MIDFARALLRRVVALAAVLFGALLAALFAALALAAALSIGAAMWLATRFGLRTVRPPGRRGADSEVIDVELREVAPGESRAKRDAGPADPAPTGDTGRRG